MTKGKQDLILIFTEIGFKAKKKLSVKQGSLYINKCYNPKWRHNGHGHLYTNSRVVIFGTLLSIC